MGTVLYCTVLYCNVVYSTVQYSTVQYGTVQYSTVQYCTLHYSTVQYSIVQYSTVQYSTVQYSTVQYCTVHYSTVQYIGRILNVGSTLLLIKLRYVIINKHTSQRSKVEYKCYFYFSHYLIRVICKFHGILISFCLLARSPPLNKYA